VSKILYEKALYIVKTLSECGFQAVYAGGCVRDLIMGNDPHDIDITTNATPDQIESVFASLKTIAVGKAFGVIVVVLEGDEFEVATFRKDSSEYSDGRHPDNVSFSTMEEDAKRRDLTINGIFFDPLTEQFFDFVNGIKDIKDGIIRLIGNPVKRIQEDKLRLMRVVRFTVRFGFKIEDETYQAVFLNASKISSVSVERVADEMTKICSFC
jgi:tRNA nucleotidyltransferase/poly(A) polymerase